MGVCIRMEMEVSMEKEGKGQTDITASADFKVASYSDFFFSYSALATSVALL